MMNTQARFSNAVLFALGALAIGCGDSDANDSDVDPGAGKPRLERVQLDRLEVTSADGPMVLHPVTVEAEIEVEGDAFESRAMIGLQAGDGEVSCSLGEVDVSQDEAGTSRLSISREFIVDQSCSAMAGRSDVELFVAFDPWRTTSIDRAGEGLTQTDPESILEMIETAVLDADGCSKCDGAMTLSESAGLDAQLREVELDASVTTLLLPAHPDQAEMPNEDRPNFVVNTTSRVNGLRRGEAPPSETFMRYRVRPLPGTADGLAQEDRQWVAMEARNETTAGVIPVEVSGSRLISTSASVYLDDEVTERMYHGAWRTLDQLEMEICVGTEYEQAVFPGESSPRDNDCANMGIVVLRETAQPTGQRAVDLGDLDELLALGAQSRDARVKEWAPEEVVLGELKIPGLIYGHYDIWDGWRFGAKAEAYYEMSSSTEGGETYGGISFPEAAMWVGAGASFDALIFGDIDGSSDYTSVFDTNVAAIAFATGGGVLEYGVSVFDQDIFGERWDSSEDAFTVTLGDVVDGDTIYTESIPVPGWGFSYEGYGLEFTVGVTLEPKIGLDPDETKITTTLGGGEVGLEATVVPLYGFDMGVGLEMPNVAIQGLLELVTLTLPVSVGAAYDYVNGKLRFEESAELGVSTLGGSVSAELCFPGLEDLLCWDGDLFAYDGFEFTHSLGTGTQEIDVDIIPELDPGNQTGGEITTEIFCERWEGDEIQIRTPGGDAYFYDADVAGPGHEHYSHESGMFHGWDEGPTTFTVECGGGAMRLVSGNRYVTADGRQSEVFDEFGVFLTSLPTEYAELTVVPQNEEGAVAFATKSGKYISAGFGFAHEYDDDGELVLGDPVRPLQESESVGDLEKWEIVPVE